MTASILRKTQELTISIETPALPKTLPENTEVINTELSATDHSFWSVRLTRKRRVLSIGVLWYRPPTCASRPVADMYIAMHLVPHHDPTAYTTTLIDASTLMAQGTVYGTIDIHKILGDDDMYRFDVIMSSSERLSRMSVVSEVVPAHESRIPPPATKTTTADTSAAVTKYQGVMKALLKDIYSVDVCFVFDQDNKSYTNTALWAHRTILSQCEKFGYMIQQATSYSHIVFSTSDFDMSRATTQSGGESLGTTLAGTTECSSITSTIDGGATGVKDDDDASTVVQVLVDNFSLGAFCVMLRYIYSGELSLTPDLSQHVVSNIDTSLVMHGCSIDKKQEFMQWNPLDSTSPWKLKDVTWEELLIIAEYFGVTELKSRCEEAVINAINASNALPTLFGVGAGFQTVKNVALDVVVDNMALMVLKGDEALLPYKEHPAFLETMFELMRRKLGEDEVV